LPRPDILVTHSRWDVFVPQDMQYGEPTTNMDLVESASWVSAGEMNEELARMKDAAGVAQMIEPLRITVPTAGVHFGFGKLYANQSEQDSWFRLPYASQAGAMIGRTTSLAGAILFWLGIVMTSRRFDRTRRILGGCLAVSGLTGTLVSIGVYHASPTPALVVTVAVALLAAGIYGMRYGVSWRTPHTVDPG